MKRFLCLHIRILQALVSLLNVSLGLSEHWRDNGRIHRFPPRHQLNVDARTADSNNSTARSKSESRHRGGRSAHTVNYEQHPFEAYYDDVSSNKRRTQITNYTLLYKPIRIQFNTVLMEDFLSVVPESEMFSEAFESVLPSAAQFWNSALSVVPVNGNLSLSKIDFWDSCSSYFPIEIAEDFWLGEGMPDTDLIFFVSASRVVNGSTTTHGNVDASNRICMESSGNNTAAAAAAFACNYDQFDRPIAAVLHICFYPENLQVQKNDNNLKALLSQETIHQMGHAMAFSPAHYIWYWSLETGQPRTQRPIQSQTVTCPGTQETRTLKLPDENTISFTMQTRNNSTYIIAFVTTPKVQNVVRNHFDCRTLVGAQLASSEDCFGLSSHWESRYFYQEMYSSWGENLFLSPLTLALFEDSGWYKANYKVSEVLPWGHGVGCDFVNKEKPCLDVMQGDSLPAVPEYSRAFFCNQKEARGCSVDRTHKASCTIIDYDYLFPREQSPGEEFQYFQNQPTLGGPKQMDYCPLFSDTYDALTREDLDCTDPNNSPLINIYAQVYGKNSQCYELKAGQGLCYQTACSYDEMKVKVNVAGQWLTCDFDFQELTIIVGDGLLKARITCPRLSQACKGLFCPHNCAGRGICNFTNSVEGAIKPKCDCFDPLDLSFGCTESRNIMQVPDTIESRAPTTLSNTQVTYTPSHNRSFPHVGGPLSIPPTRSVVSDSPSTIAPSGFEGEKGSSTPFPCKDASNGGTSFLQEFSSSDVNVPLVSPIWWGLLIYCMYLSI